MNVLAIGAHYDDLELGCGGTLARMVREGHNVWGYVVTRSGYATPEGVRVRKDEDAREEGKRAADIIGYQLISGEIPTFEVEANEKIQAGIMSLVEDHEIDMVLTHWIYDAHHDHRNLAAATLHCTKHVPRVLMYRSNWYQTDRPFDETFFVDISDTWSTKEKAIREYAGELGRTGDTWIRYFKNQAQNYGIQCGAEFAECFEPVKWKM